MKNKIRLTNSFEATADASTDIAEAFACSGMESGKKFSTEQLSSSRVLKEEIPWTAFLIVRIASSMVEDGRLCAIWGVGITELFIKNF